MSTTFHIGADENGLGSRLGPMIVTAVLAEVTPEGERFLARKLPKRMREDLDDSKRLMSHLDVGIGEAWARALTEDRAQTPAELFELVSLEGSPKLREPCPKAAGAQCWTSERESFCATAPQLERARVHPGRDLPRQAAEALGDLLVQVQRVGNQEAQSQSDRREGPGDQPALPLPGAVARVPGTFVVFVVIDRH